MIASRQRKLRTCLATSAFLLAVSGCEVRQESSQYPISFRGMSDEGDVIPGVVVSVAGVELGKTDQQGFLQVVLTGAEGDRPDLRIQCPKGTTEAGPVPPLLLRHVESASGNAGAEVTVRCQPDKRIAALLVNAPGFANLPVLVHGQEVARTDGAGVAHVVLDGAPHTPMRVVLDTSARPYIEPKSPHKDVRIGRRDEIVVFSPELKEQLPKPVRKQKRKEEPVVVEEKIIRPERL